MKRVGALITTIRWGLRLLVLILLLALVLLVLVFGTQSGTRYVLNMALGFVPQAEVESIHGSLWDGVTLENIRYDDGAGTTAEVGHVRLALSWPALSGARLHVPELLVAAVRIRLPESEPTEKSDAPLDLTALIPKLPLAIQIDQLNLRDVALQPSPDAEWIHLTSLTTAASVDRFWARIPHLELVLEAPVAAKLQLEASLSMLAPHSLAAKVEGDLALEAGQVAEAIEGQVRFRVQTQGHIDSEGQLDHHTRLDDLTGVLAGVPFEALGLTVRGDLERMTIEELAGRILNAQLAGGAQLRLGQESIDWDAKLSLDHADLGTLQHLDIDTGLTGWVGLDLSSQGQWRDGQAFLTATLSNLRGELAGQPLSGKVEARVQGDVVSLEPAAVAIGANQLWLHGTVTPPFDLQYRLALPTLDSLPLPPNLVPTLAGAIDGEGRLRGTLLEPDVHAQLSGRDLVIDQLRLAEIDLTARADTKQLDLELTLKQLQAADHTVSAAQLKANGTLPNHTLIASADTDLGRVELGLTGGLESQRWTGRLTTLNLLKTLAGDWRLAEPVALHLAETDFSLAQTCLLHQPSESEAPRADASEQPQQSTGRLCLAASQKPDKPIMASLEALLPLQLGHPFLPPTLRLPGDMMVSAEARIGKTITAEAVVTLPDNRIIAHGWTDEPLNIDYRDTRIDLSLRDEQLNAQVSMLLPEYMALEGTLRANLEGAQSLAGELHLDMPDLAWLNALTSDITDLSGQAYADITLSGTLTQPRPTGRIIVDNLAVNVPLAGVAYERGRLFIDIDAEQQLTLEGQLAGVSAGELKFAGSGTLAELPNWRLQLQIDGEDLPLLRTNELVVDASTELAINADQSAAEIYGRLLLPRVEARVHSLPEGAVKESPDLILAGHEDPVPDYPVRTDIEIVLGEKVTLEGMGLSAGLAGQIRLRGDETAPISAFGEVDIMDGRYAAYGQDLQITRGRLSFNGPLDDPGLNVRASRTVDQFQVGLEITGTLSDPRSQVFSVPALAESDALSLLLTGRRLSEGTSGADASLLINALAGLGVARGDEIARDIGQVVGFDELGLDTVEGLEGTQLTVGKRLNSRLLVRYAVGVFNGVGKFITEYKINRYLDLKISSSPEAQSGDLIYRTER